MPGNLVVINGSEGFTWYVGDSKIDELIRFLHEIGFQEQPKAPIKEGMMEIRIKLGIEEVKELIETHVLETLPMNFDSKEIHIHESYGTFTVDIIDKPEAPEEVNNEAIDDVSSIPVLEVRGDNLK